MNANKILNDLRKGNYKPIYWLEGEEDFFIDQVIQYAENHILTADEAAFNRTILYGKDTNWTELVNTCRKYPMFSERQVVILKEAQAMGQIEKLEPYIDKPLTSTILFVAYKNKKLDGRLKMAKLLKDRAEVLTTKKLYDNELPQWTSEMVQSKGLSINNKALQLLIDHIGNDLSRLSNEVDKLSINLTGKSQITEDDIETYVGVSKEFNVFELQQAIARKDLYKAMRIVQYFEANPKAASIMMVLPSLYNYFSKIPLVHAANTKDERALGQAIGVHSFFVKDYIQTATRFNKEEVEKVMLLLHQYNLKGVGLHTAPTTDAMLMKEMIMKMIT